MIKQGINPNISNKDYHADLDYLSNSGLQKFSSSPARYHYQLDHPAQPSEAMETGTAFHCVMEKGVISFQKVYSRIIEGNGATKAVKESKAAIISDGKIPLKPDVFDSVLQMRKSVEIHEKAGQLVKQPGINEATIATCDPETGTKIKCRPDRLSDSGVIVDYKTSIDASPTGFAKSAAKFGYHRQAAFYLDCCYFAEIDVVHFCFIAVEKTPPYLVGVYVLDGDAIRLGWALNQRDLSRFSICQARNEWPGYSNKVETLSLPNWAFSEL